MSIRETLQNTIDDLEVAGYNIGVPHVAVFMIVTILAGGVGGFVAGGGSLGAITPQPAPDYEFPNGTNQTEISNTTALMNAHNETLAAEGYTLIVDSSQTVNGTTSNSSRVFEYDANQKRLLVTNNGKTGTYIVYASAGKPMFSKYVAGNKTQYNARPSRGFSAYTGADLFGSRLSALITEYDTTTTYDGTAVAKYTITGVNHSSSVNASNYDVSGHLLVDEDGVVRRMVVDIHNKKKGANVTEEFTVARIGNTTVDEPSWLQEAVNQTMKKQTPPSQDGGNQTDSNGNNSSE